MAHDPFEHVMDQDDRWQFFDTLFGGAHVELPSFVVFGHTFHVTKFMILELLAAVLLLVIFVPLGRRAARGDVPRGAWWNAFESLLTFIRNEVAKPTLAGGHEPHHGGGHGHHADEHGDGHAHKPHASPEDEVDRYVPVLWTLSRFILF